MSGWAWRPLHPHACSSPSLHNCTCLQGCFPLHARIQRLHACEWCLILLRRCSTCRWAVVSRSLQPPLPRGGVTVAETRVALAFRLAGPGPGPGAGPAWAMGTAAVDAEAGAAAPAWAPGWRPPQQPVFAYLPLRSYGLRFIVQVGGHVQLKWCFQCIYMLATLGEPAVA